MILEGDPKKLVGRAVDEDVDVLDKRANVVGHADRYEKPEPKEAFFASTFDSPAGPSHSAFFLVSYM